MFKKKLVEAEISYGSVKNNKQNEDGHQNHISQSIRRSFAGFDTRFGKNSPSSKFEQMKLQHQRTSISLQSQLQFQNRDSPNKCKHMSFVNDALGEEDDEDDMPLDEYDFERLLKNEEDLENQVANANVFQIGEIAKSMIRKK